MSDEKERAFHSSFIIPHSSLNKSLDRFELFVARVAQEFKERHFGGGGKRAGLLHLREADVFVVRGAGGDAIS